MIFIRKCAFLVISLSISGNVYAINYSPICDEGFLGEIKERSIKLEAAANSWDQGAADMAKEIKQPSDLRLFFLSLQRGASLALDTVGLIKETSSPSASTATMNYVKGEAVGRAVETIPTTLKAGSVASKSGSELAFVYGNSQHGFKLEKTALTLSKASGYASTFLKGYKAYGTATNLYSLYSVSFGEGRDKGKAADIKFSELKNEINKQKSITSNLIDKMRKNAFEKRSLATHYKNHIRECYFKEEEEKKNNRMALIKRMSGAYSEAKTSLGYAQEQTAQSLAASHQGTMAMGAALQNSLSQTYNSLQSKDASISDSSFTCVKRVGDVDLCTRKNGTAHTFSPSPSYQQSSSQPRGGGCPAVDRRPDCSSSCFPKPLPYGACGIE